MGEHRNGFWQSVCLVTCALGKQNDGRPFRKTRDFDENNAASTASFTPYYWLGNNLCHDDGPTRVVSQRVNRDLCGQRGWLYRDRVLWSLWRSQFRCW